MQSLAPQADAEVTSSAPPAQAELPEASPARQAGDSVAASLARLGRTLSAPLLGIMIFLGIWGVMAPRVDTSLGALPGPVEVAGQGIALWGEYREIGRASCRERVCQYV